MGNPTSQKSKANVALLQHYNRDAVHATRRPATALCLYCRSEPHNDAGFTHAPLPHNEQVSFPASSMAATARQRSSTSRLPDPQGSRSTRRTAASSRHFDPLVDEAHCTDQGRITSCFLIVSQAWPTRNSSMPPRRPASSRLREAKIFGTPSSARTTSMAEA